MNYQVSIIIPIYNSRNYVIKTLETALNQSFKSIEYILVDDCSTDDSMQLIEKYASFHSRKKDIKIVHNSQNSGLSASRNIGMTNATGEYIFFMDSDDEITENCIELHYNAIKKNYADFTVANIFLKGAKSIHIKSIPYSMKEDLPFLSFFKRDWSVSACNKLYRRAFLEINNLSFKNRLIHEDILWSYQISSKAKKLAIVHDTTYIYIIHQNSITTTKSNALKINSLLYILHYMEDDRRNDNIPSAYLNNYYKVFDFWRLNTAILLLNYNGETNDLKKYYMELYSLRNGTNLNLYAIILKLPFHLFMLIGKLAYRIYKN